MTYRHTLPAEGEHARERRFVDAHAAAESGGGFVAAALLAVAVFFMLAAYSAHQVTSRERADQLLGAGIATTTEIDLVLEEALPSLRERAAEDPADQYDLRGFPLAVQVTHEELTTSSTSEIRALILARSVGQVYGDGLGAFDRTGAQDFGFLSIGSLAEQMVGQITDQRHTQAGWIAVILAGFAAIASVTVVVMYEGFRRFRALGLAFVFGAVPGIAATWLVGLAIGRLLGSDPYSQDLDRIIDAMLGVAQRNYLIVAILGAIVAISGPALAFVAERLPGADEGLRYADEPDDEAWYGYDEDAGYHDDDPDAWGDERDADVFAGADYPADDPDRR